MRVLLDTSVLIAYLLSPQGQGPATEVVRRALTGEFVVLVPNELLVEVEETIAETHYLARRIPPKTVQNLIEALGDIGEGLGLLPDEIPHVSRDVEDDYLIAYAQMGQADYLVSYDKDLFDLGQVGKVKILHPAVFLKALRK